MLDRENDLREMADRFTRNGTEWPLQLWREIDRLRAGLHKAHQEIADYDGERDAFKAESDDWAANFKICNEDRLAAIKERDELRAENEKLKNFLSPAGQEEFLLLEQRDNLRKVNQSLRERIEKLRKALKSIAAPHLEPFCPELFDSMWEEVYNDTVLAREALAQDDERCKHDVHGEDCFTCYPEEKKR